MLRKNTHPAFKAGVIERENGGVNKNDYHKMIDQPIVTLQDGEVSSLWSCHMSMFFFHLHGCQAMDMSYFSVQASWFGKVVV